MSRGVRSLVTRAAVFQTAPPAQGVAESWNESGGQTIHHSINQQCRGIGNIKKGQEDMCTTI